MTARPAPLTMTQHQWDLYAYARRESTQAAPEGALSFDAVALFDECCALRAQLAAVTLERDALRKKIADTAKSCRRQAASAASEKCAALIGAAQVLESLAALSPTQPTPTEGNES